MINLGRTEEAQGDLAAARQMFLEALQLAQQANLVPRMLEALMALTIVWSQIGWRGRAFEVLEFVRIHAMTPQETRDQAERLYAELATQLTPEQIEAVQTQAWTQTLEVMVQEILEAA